MLTSILGDITIQALVIEICITTLVALAIYVSVATGVLSLVFPGTMAVGAYVYGGLAVNGYPSWSAALLAILGGAVIGGLAGVAVARLTGFSAAIATFAFAQVIQVFFQNFSPTGGVQGLANVPMTTTWINSLVLTTVITIVVVAMAFSRLGLRWKAVEVDELAAECMGIRVRATRATGQVLAGAIAALAGLLSAGYTAFVDPGQFGITQLNNYLLPAILGGITTPIGPPIGAGLTTLLSHALDNWGSWRPIVFSALVIVLILFRRNGIITVRRVHKIRITSDQVPEVPDPRAVEVQKVSLSATEIRKHFFGIEVLRGVSFATDPGEVMGIVGANGAGKTTLVNILSGVLPRDGGHLELGSEALRFKRPHQSVRHGLARTFQNLRLFPGLTVTENILLSRTSANEVLRLLSLLGLEQHKDSVATELPYGLQRRVEIARAMALRPRIMMLDEPTAGMTAAESAEVRTIIDQLRRSGTGVLVIDHNLPFLSSVADRLLVMHTGEVLALDSPSTVLADARVVAAYMGAVDPGTSSLERQDDIDPDLPVASQTAAGANVED